MSKPKSRGNGQGTAYRRIVNGKMQQTWTAQYVYDWKLPADPSKPRIPLKRTKGGFATKRDALEYISTLKISKPKDAPKLSFYWSTYENGQLKSLSNSKQTAYKIAWNKLSDLHNIQVDELTVDTLQKTVDKTCTSYYTAKDARTVLISLFKFAMADGFANVAVPSMIHLPQLEEKEREVFTPEEQEKIWASYESGNVKAALPLLMLYTGLMPGETMPLKVEQFDIENRIITGAGIKTKVRKKTPVVIAEVLLPVVQDLIDNARPDGYLWTQSKDDFYQMYYDAIESANVRKLPPYSCRHSFATRLSVDENVAPQTIKRVMRWSTAKMLDRYSHPDTKDALDAVDKLKKD